MKYIDYRYCYIITFMVAVISLSIGSMFLFPKEADFIAIYSFDKRTLLRAFQNDVRFIDHNPETNITVMRVNNHKVLNDLRQQGYITFKANRNGLCSQ